MSRDFTLKIEERVLKELLQYLKEKNILSEKDKEFILGYAIQTEDSKKPGKDTKFSKIRNKMRKKKELPTAKEFSAQYDSIKRKIQRNNSISKIPAEDYSVAYMKLDEKFDLAKGDCTSFIYFVVDDIQREQKRIQEEKAKNKLGSRPVESRGNEPEMNDNAGNTELAGNRQSQIDMPKGQAVQEQLKREEEAYKYALNSTEYPSAFENISGDLEQRKRLEYLRDSLTIEWKLDNQDKDDVLFNIRNMMKDSQKIQKLMEIHLKKTSIPSANNSEIAEATYNKYDPYKLLVKYGKQYERIKKQLEKIGEDQKIPIQEYFEKNGIEFIPSQQDILDRVNENMGEFIYEHGYGQEEDQQRIMVGLTRYMSQEQVSALYFKMKDGLKKIYGDEESKSSQGNKGNPGAEKIKNVQKSACMSIASIRGKDKKKEKMTLTEICEQILREQPLFKETQILPEQIAKLDQETSLTTTEVGFWKGLIIQIKKRFKRKIGNIA